MCLGHSILRGSRVLHREVERARRSAAGLAGQQPGELESSRARRSATGRAGGLKPCQWIAPDALYDFAAMGCGVEGMSGLSGSVVFLVTRPLGAAPSGETSGLIAGQGQPRAQPRSTRGRNRGREARFPATSTSPVARAHKRGTLGRSDARRVPGSCSLVLESCPTTPRRGHVGRVFGRLVRLIDRG